MPTYTYTLVPNDKKLKHLTLEGDTVPTPEDVKSAALEHGVTVVPGEIENVPGQIHAQAESGVWGSILRNAPEALKAYGKSLVSVPSGIGHLLMSSPQQLHDEQLMPVVNATREAIAHPSEIGPAFLQGAADPTVMGTMAGNLTALAALNDIPGTGRLLTRGVTQIARPIDALAQSIPAQRAVSGAASGAAAAALGLPGGEAADALIGAVLGQKTGAIGVIPEAEATKAVTTALTDLTAAKKFAATNPTPEVAATVTEARNLLKAAQIAQARSTTIGKLTTGLAKGLRWPDQALQRLGTPPTLPPSAPSPIGWTPEEWVAANAPPPAAPTVPLPPNPLAGAPPTVAQTELSTPGAQAFSDTQFAKNQPIAQATLGAQVGALPSSPPPVVSPPPSTIARLTDAAPPQHFDPNAATFDKATSAGGRYAPGTEPQPLPPSNPAIARDAVVAQNRADAGVIQDVGTQRAEILDKMQPTEGAPWAAHAADMAKSEVIHPTDINAPIPPNYGTQAEIRGRLLADLKNPTMTQAEIRVPHGADRMGTEYSPERPEASANAVRAAGPEAPKWISENGQKPVLRDIRAVLADPANPLKADGSSIDMNRFAATIKSIVAKNTEFGGPRQTPFSLEVHRLLQDPVTRKVLEGVIGKYW